MKDVSVLNIIRFAQQQRFYCNFQLIESHCIHAVSLIEINIPELPLLNATLYEVTEDSIPRRVTCNYIIFMLVFIANFKLNRLRHCTKVMRENARKYGCLF